MKSREQTAIEALTEHQAGRLMEKAHNFCPLDLPHLDKMRWMAKHFLASLAALTPPAQGSIDADGLPPLPEPDHALDCGAQPFYNPDQMRAYALADRAAIHSNEGLLELVVAQLKERLAKAGAQIERLESAARQSAAPKKQGLSELVEKYGNLTTVANALDRQSAPAPSEPVPQGVPEGWKLVPIKLTEEMHGAAVRELRGCTGNGDFPPRIHAAMLAAAPTAPTATGGGEAVAKVTQPDRYHFDIEWVGNGAERCQEGDMLYRAPPLPATDAASVPSCPEMQKAFMTLESNGQGRILTLRFNQSADAYAVHDFLLKSASAIGLMYPGDASSVRVSALEEAAQLCEESRPASRENCPEHWKWYEKSWSLRELVANECATAIRALISKETTHGN